MLDQLSDNGRRVLSSAVEIARRSGEQQMRGLHLLLALTQGRKGAGMNAMKELGIDLFLLEQRVLGLLDASPGLETEGEITFSPAIKACLELAAMYARHMNHSPLGTDHLLLGLIGVHDEEVQLVLGEDFASEETLQATVKKLRQEEHKEIWSRIARLIPKGGIPGPGDQVLHFGEHARRALEIAYIEAELHKQGFLDIEHLLLGVLTTVLDNGLEIPGMDVDVIDPAEVRQRVKEKVSGRAPAPDVEPSLTVRSNKVIELAAQEAYLLGDADICIEHLLLGLLGFEKGFCGDLLHMDLTGARQAFLEQRGDGGIKVRPSIDLARYKIDRDLLNLVPGWFAMKHMILPVHQRRATLTVA
ncbi:hypothetical protein JW905_13565, partial [bacterium]|nr:hypothetical protein [candidate division CSSED10-310 bacterium]